MKLVVQTEPGRVELAFMWLPTWLGLSTPLKEEIEHALRPELEGQPMTEDVLERAHGRVLDLLEAKFPEIEGLRAYLDGIRHVSLPEAP